MDKHPTGRSVVRLLTGGLLLLLTVVTSAVGAGPAAAHGQLLQASPGPGQQAGGLVDFIDLAFLEDARDTVVVVTQNGAPVPGTTTVANGRIVRYAFNPPLTVPGRYDVTFTATWVDNDRVTETYYFNYDPTAPPPVHIGSAVAPPASGWSTVRIVATVVLVTAMAGLAFLYLLQLERRRSRAAADRSGGPDGPGGTARGEPADPARSRRA